MQFQSLVGELSSHKPHGEAKKKNRQLTQKRWLLATNVLALGITWIAPGLCGNVSRKRGIRWAGLPVDFYLVFLACLSLFPCPLSILIGNPPGGFSPAHLLGRDFPYSWRQASMFWETQVPWSYNEDVALLTNRFHWVPCSKQPQRWKYDLCPKSQSVSRSVMSNSFQAPLSTEFSWQESWSG